MTQPIRSQPDAGLGRPHFVVTGCARSATTYTARLLSEAGCTCTHESVFGPHERHFPGWGSAQGDSSWLAVPFLDELPPETIVIHQVREPLRAVDALVRFQVFSDTPSGMRRDAVALARYLRGGGVRALFAGLDPRRRRARGRRLRSDFVDFLRLHCPEAFLETNEPARAARHWVAWNTRIEESARAAGLTYRRVQVEQLDAETLSSLVEMLGGDADPQVLRTATQAVTKEANRQPGGPSSPITRAILGDDLTLALESAAKHYGYRVEVA